tara:strand:+ start:247 stop:678 length:432 start_codon:yes stop_codon:yes gene_type:complete
MTVNLTMTSNFGTSLSGKVGTIGVTIYNSEGTETQSRTTSGIYELGSETGLYGCQISVANSFSGSIVWDVSASESSPTQYAMEDFSTDSIFTRDMIEGKWKIDSSSKQMIFYKKDNSTEIARFDLKDSDGSASVSSVFERIRA